MVFYKVREEKVLNLVWLTSEYILIVYRNLPYYEC